jgi:hypothetical protein
VTDADGGYFAVVDSTSQILYTSPPYSADKGGGHGMLNVNRVLNHVSSVLGCRVEELVWHASLRRHCISEGHAPLTCP